MSTLAGAPEDGQGRELQRLLLGTSVASPFATKDDPDPPSMPIHPTSDHTESIDSLPQGPPSPSSRFFSRTSQPSRRPTVLGPPPPLPASQQPCTFFIFPDISIRRAGDYRLEFSLMFMDQDSLGRPGNNVPILSIVASQVFKVVNAKDFDQVKASTSLVRGLVERGAGFPLKLKKGTRGPAGGAGSATGDEGPRMPGEFVMGEDDDEDSDDDME
jgi:hypothetical protein